MEKKKRTGKPGSVIHATLRNEDLIPAFAGLLLYVDNKRYWAFLKKNPDLRLAQEAKYFDRKTDWWETEEATEVCNDLIDILNEYAPVGFYFGSHPGDGSDFGFWENSLND